MIAEIKLKKLISNYLNFSDFLNLNAMIYTWNQIIKIISITFELFRQPPKKKF